MRLIAIITLAAMFFICPVFLPSGAFGESPPKAEEKTAPQMPFIKEAGERYAGRFPLKKVGSHYVYVHYTDKNGKPKEKPLDAITIPGTEITAGVFPYEFIDERGEKNNFPPKTGALINDSVYYAESCDKYGCGHLDMSGNPTFGIYKDYLTIDACAFGASGCNNRMLLFRYTKDSVKLLDVIMTAGNICANFFSESEPKPRANKKGRVWWARIADFDNDGNPEIIIWMNCGVVRFEKTFKLFLEIKDDKLQVDFNPELYKPLFKEIERESKNKKQKPDAYYVYGFLSGKLSLKKITAMLAGKEYRGEKEDYIISILKKRATWDAGFHDYGSKPVLIRHNLKNQKEVE